MCWKRMEQRVYQACHHCTLDWVPPPASTYVPRSTMYDDLPPNASTARESDP
ncbi:hypothetical protein BC628DRAFT_1418275 [Trametes gibbosa]|nr:hypothetical protein BC628DRAFT_1418275 [Trametes gibbosa]